MRKLLTICAILLSLSASAQWQLTGSRVRYVNGIGIPTRDTSAMTPADSSQILIRPADSALYVRYKRAWMRVGGGGGSIAGSGTTNYIPKFTSSSAIGNSQIFDNGTSVGIGTTSPSNKVDIFTTNRTALNTVGSGLNVNYNGSTTGEFATIGFSWASSLGNISTQWGMGMVGTNFGAGTAALNLFTNGAERMRITSAGNVGIGTTSPSSRLDVSGTATATNLSVTTNATVGGTVTGGSFIPTSSTAPANGMYLQAANSVSLIANSVERIRMPSGLSIIIDPTSAGDLLVGKTTDDGTDKLQVAGSIQGTGFNQAYLARTTTYTAATNDYVIDCTSGTFTVNLFTAVGNTGRILIIKNSGTGTITVDPNGSQTIDGATTQSLATQWSRVHIISDGANWKIISN